MKTEFLHRGWGRFAAVAAVLACLLSAPSSASAATFLAGAVSNFPDRWSVDDDGTSVTGGGIANGGYASVTASGELAFDLDAKQSLTYAPVQVSDAGGTADVVISNAVFTTAYELPGVDEVGGIDSQAAICVYTNTASGGALSYYGWAGDFTVDGIETNLTWFALSGATPAEGATNTVTMSFDYTASPATVTFKIGDTTLTPSANELATSKDQVSAVSFSGKGSISELAGESVPGAPSTFEVSFYDDDATTVLFGPTNVPAGSAPAYLAAAPTKQATAQFVYEFAGWTNAASANAVVTLANETIVSPTNYYATYTAKTKIAAPTANTGLVYNGTQQTGVTAGTGYSLTGNTGTAAGDGYSATATLDAGYVWNDETTAPKSIPWSIGKAALSVTAQAGSIVYGDAPAANGVTYSGFVAGDDENVLGGTLSYAYSYSQFGDVGSYTITPSGLTSDNYAITFNTGTLTVTAKEVGLTWGTTTFGYDGASHAPTATATGLVNGDEVGVTVTGDKTDVGSGYTATASALTGAKSGNYTLPAANTTTFSITEATIVVTPTAGQSKTYGASDPTLAYTATLGGEPYSGSFSGALSRAPGENVGTYAISAGDLAATDANYAVSVASGVTFAITAAEIAVPSGSNATYDGSVKTGLAEGTGYTRGGDYTATAAGDYTATATPDANHVWVGGGTAAQNVDWSIAKATVAVAAEAKEQVYGAEAVPLTYTAGSLVAGNSFSGALAREAGDNVGTYAINIGTLSAGDNYTIDFTGANYVIVGAAITPVVSITGWTAGDTPNSPSVSGNTGNGEVTYYYSADSGANWTTTQPTEAGTYLVKASVAAAGNYAGGESDPVEFTIAEPVVPTLALAKPTIASTVLESGVAGATVKVTVDPAAVVTATNANVAFTSEGAVTNATFTGLPWNEAVDWMLQSEGAEDLPGRFYAKGETEWFNVATNALDDIADLAEGMKGVEAAAPSAAGQMVRIQTCLEISEGAMEDLPVGNDVGEARTGFAVAQIAANGDTAPAFYAFNGTGWDKLVGATPVANTTNDLLIVLDVEASTARYYVDGIALYTTNAAGVRAYALPMKASDSAVIHGIGFANPDGVKSAVVAEYDVPFEAAVGDTPYAAAAAGLAAADKTGVETLYLLTNGVVGTIDLALDQSVKVDTAKGSFAAAEPVVLAQSVPAGYAIKATGEGSVTNYTVDIVEYPIVWNLDLAGATNAVANTLTNSYTVANLPITLFPAGCEGYTFDGWTNNVSAGAITNMIAPGTTGAVTNWATWHQNAFTITWNIEGATTTTDVLPGVVPSYEGTPSKDVDDTYTYEFAGWSDTQGGSVIANLPGATESTTYFAIFTPVYINYTIEWTDHSGTVKSETLHYGDTPTAPATAPATYVENGKIFTGTWPAPSAVSGSTSYAAVYDAGVDAIATVITIANNGATTNTVGTYASLAAAVADAPAGATVVLLADDSVSFTAQNLEIGISKALTIDGDGHTLYGLDDYAGSGDHDIYISGSDDVTIKNITLAEFGGAVPVTGRTYPIWTGSAYAGTLTLDNVTVESFNRTAFNLNGGTVVVKDCTIAGDTTKNPYFQEGIGVYNANVTVENTTITGAGSTMEKEDSQIAGCIQLGNPNGAVPGTGSVLVKSGSFTGEYGILVASNALNAVTVQGGTFNGALMAEEGEGGTIVVDGGLFNAPVPAEFAGTGLAPTTIADNDGKYTVRTARTVTFEVDNSVVYTNIVVADGEPVARPTDPTKDHYGFRAWQTNGVDWVFTDAVTADLTLVADWRIDTFTVVWLAEDGETQLDATNGIPYGTVYASLEAPAPTKPATAQFTYAFAGWTPPPEETVTSNATYTAVFTETTNKYDVIWVADGQDPVTNTVDHGTAIASIKPADPSKAADAEFTYEFSAWTPALDETVTSNATYTAVFTKTKNQYNVIWVADGSQFASNRLDYGAAIVAPAENPTKAADAQYTYAFANWTPALDATVTSNATYAAVFTETVNKYLVTFDSNGGSAVASTNVAYGTTVTKPADPTRGGFNFVEWLLNGAAYDFSKPVTNAITLVAHWADAGWEISWYDENGDLIEKTNVEAGQTPAHDAPAKANTAEWTYEFAGWATAQGGEALASLPVATANASYYAVFTATKNSYNVIWVADGATVLSNRLDYGAAIVAPAENPTKSGDGNALYTFVKWTPAQDATVTSNATYVAEFKTWAKIPVPTAETGLVYDGTTKTGVAAGTGYTLTDNTGVAASNYVATVTLADPDNTVWADDTVAPSANDGAREIAWSIAKAPMTITVAGVDSTAVYTGAEQTTNVAWTATCEGETLFDATKVFYAGTQTVFGTDVGDYLYNLDVTKFSYADNNYAATFTLEGDGKFTITPAAITITVAGYTGIYDGAAHAASAETVPADATVLWSVDGGEFTATVPSVTGVTNVTVVAKATMANYTDATATTSLVVTAAVVDIPAAPGNKTYNGVAQTADVASADTYTVTNEGGTNAGDYTVEFALKDKANYVWSDGSTTNQTFGWSIAKAAATIVVDNASKKHGEADPAFDGTVEGLFADGDLGAVSYGRTNATEAVGVYAGVIVPTYTPNANYDVTVTPGTFAIESNEITIIWVVDGGETTNKVEWGDMPAFAGSTDKEDETGKYAYTFTGWTPEVTNATVLATYTAGYSAAIATPLALAVADPKLASTAVDALQKTATVKAGLVGAVDGVSVKLDDNTDVPVDAATATASFSDLDWNEGVEWTMTATQTAEDASNTVETAELPGKFYAKPEKAWFSATTNDFYAVNDASDAAFAYTNEVASAEGEMVRVHTRIEVPAGGLPQAPETGSAKVGFAVLQLEGDAAPAYYAFGNGVWTKLAGVAPAEGEHDYYAVYDLAAETPTARYYIDGLALYAEGEGGAKTYALPLAATTRSLSGISFASKEMVKDDVVAEHDISYVAAVGQTPYTNIVDALTAAGTAGENTLALLKAGVPLDPAVSLGSGEKLVVDYAKGSFTNETPVVTGVAGYRVAVTPGEGSVTNYALDAIEYRIGYDLALEGATLPADYPTNFTVETLPVTLPIASREGYSFEGWTNNVSGNEIAATIPAGTTNDVDNVARWSINDYLLTITYTGPEGFPAQDPVASNVVYGTAYSVPSPAVTGYTPDVAVVAGTMGAAPVTTNVVYAANLHKITYQITGDYFADDEFEVVENVAYGTELSPIGTDMAKEGYTFSDWAGLPEKMPDEDVVVTGSYQINSYQLKVTYVTPEGVEAPAVFASNVVYNTDYSVPSPAITGYSPDVAVVSGTMPAAAVTTNVTYTAIKYTVAFVDDDGTTVLKAATEYDYGTPAADIEKPADPTKSATAEKVYTFAGWTPAIETVTSNAVYKASYSETDTKAAVISVAQDGTTNTIYVATIADAIAAAEDGDTVQLLADVSEPAVAISDKEITLDLNGHDWTVVAAEEGGEPGTIEISGGGGVTAVDSSVGGDKGSIVSAAEPVVTLADGVTLTIRSGATIESSTANGQAISIQSGSVTVDGGIVAGDIATGENGRGRIEVSSGSVAGSIVAGDNVGVEISGGAVSGSVTGGEGDIEIFGGTVAGSVTSGGWTSIYGDASVGGVVANEGAEVEISGGTVTGGVVANDGAKVEISGGTVEGGVVANEGAEVAISGGTVDGTLAGTSETLVVTGGHFDNDPSDYVADGYYADGNEVEGYDVIRRIPLEGAVITVAGGPYKGTGYTVSSVDFGTTNLVIDEDCTVAYTNATDNVADNVNVGTIGVTVTGIGRWTGTVTTSFVITPATLTVTAKDATVRRGSANLPAFEYEYDGFVNGETVADLATQLSDPVVTNALGEAYSTSARTGDAFAIVPTGATAANYAITFVDGTLTVVAGAIAAVDGTEYDAIAAAVAAAGTTEDGTVVVMLDDADAAVTLVPDDVLKIQLDGFDVSVAVDDAYAARWSLVSNTVEGVTTYTLDEIKARGLMITEFDYEGAFLVFDPGRAEDLAWASDEAYCTVVTATDLTATRWAAVSGTSKLHSVWAAEAEAKVEDLDTTADVRFFRIAVTPFELTSGDTVEFAAPAAGDEQP